MRRTVYLDNAEERALEELASELSASASYVLRVALRLLVGLPTAAWALERAQEERREASGAATR